MSREGDAPIRKGQRQRGVMRRLVIVAPRYTRTDQVLDLAKEKVVLMGDKYVSGEVLGRVPHAPDSERSEFCCWVKVVMGGVNE